jgi:transcriptional regulator with XRE-family HTH domain
MGGRTATESERKEFGRRLEKLMLAKGYTQSDLARRANDRMIGEDNQVGRYSINAYVKGRSVPSKQRLIAIAEALECDISELLPATEAELPVGEHLTVRATGHGRMLVSLERKVTLATAAAILQLLESDKDAQPSQAANPTW